MKKNILVVLSVQTKSNPAFLSIYQSLKDNFNIKVLGVENFKFEDKSIDYTNFSFLLRLYYKLKFHYLVKICTLLCFKKNRGKIEEYWNFKIRLLLLRIGFLIKVPKDIDFVLCIDTEAAYLSRTKKNNSGFFIYEIYAEQDLTISSKLRKLKNNIEKYVVHHAKFMISSCNDEIGKLLNIRNKAKTDILVYSVCPIKEFSNETTVNDPIKFYYHGVFFENRGIENAILAFKEIVDGELYLRGFGYYESFLKELVKVNKLEHKVFFLDPVEMIHLPKYGITYDVGVSLVRMNVVNHQYNIGFKTFENISSGLALLVPKSYPLGKLIDYYDNGLYYEDATIEQLRRSFEFVINNKNLIEKWKLNSKVAYEKEYNPERQKIKLINKLNQYL